MSDKKTILNQQQNSNENDISNNSIDNKNSWTETIIIISWWSSIILFIIGLIMINNNPYKLIKLDTRTRVNYVLTGKYSTFVSDISYYAVCHANITSILSTTTTILTNKLNSNSNSICGVVSDKFIDLTELNKYATNYCTNTNTLTGCYDESSLKCFTCNAPNFLHVKNQKYKHNLFNYISYSFCMIIIIPICFLCFNINETISDNTNVSNVNNYNKVSLIEV